MDRKIKIIEPILTFSLTLLFLIGKLVGWIDWDWVWIVSPMWIQWIGTYLLISLVIGFLYLRKNFKQWMWSIHRLLGY